MTDRSGPRASVVLSCDKCVHRKEIRTPQTLHYECRKTGRLLPLGMDTPNWCPLHPRRLIVVHLAVADDWNVTRSELMNSARALGQEVNDEKPR